MACFTMGSLSSFVLTLLYFLGLSFSAATGPFASNVLIKPEDFQYRDRTRDTNITGSLLEDVQTKILCMAYALYPRNIDLAIQTSNNRDVTYKYPISLTQYSLRVFDCNVAIVSSIPGKAFTNGIAMIHCEIDQGRESLIRSPSPPRRLLYTSTGMLAASSINAPITTCSLSGRR
ncbi:hypothetical protein N7G274_005832 [Stereocaulon virgatum]|uniref:Uncharacterized protein n=1 Tax=Stereocaulon virgatum TaxID=373712 RepID=A0ABR4A6K4_9LECA